MSNIVLVVPPADIYLSPLLGIGILYAMAKEAGHNVEVIDLNIDLYNSAEINQLSWSRCLNFYWNTQDVCNFIWDSSMEDMLENCVKRLPFKNVDIVGIRIAADSRLMTYKVARWFRENSPDTFIVVGGPDTWFEEPKQSGLFDKVLIGYAESGFAKLVGQGVNYPKPDFGFAKGHKYLYPNIAPVETSRGCIHKCTFCKERQFTKFFICPYGVVEQNLYNAKRAGYKEIYFVDSLLNHTVEHLKNVLNILYKLGLKCKCNLTPINIDDHCISLMKETVVRTFFGIETFSDSFAKQLGKPGSRKTVIENLKKLRRYGVSAETGIIIAGTPFQSKKELDEDINTIISYSDVLSKVILSPLRIYKGTSLRKNNFRYPTAIGWWKNDPEEFRIRLEWLVEMSERLDHAGVSLDVPLLETKGWVKGMFMETRG